MMTKKKPAAAAQYPVEARRRAATAMVDGTICGAVTAKYMGGVEGGADVHDVRACVAEVVKSLASEDFSVLEAMLLQQATTLQAMFADLALRANAQTSRDNLQVITTLALKAAAGSRQAITALAELRMPKQVLFAKQANVNHGGQQQVNNGPAAQTGPVRAGAGARAGENSSQQNELLEAPHENTLIAPALADPTAAPADPLPARSAR